MRFVPALVFLLSVYVVNGFIPTERLHAVIANFVFVIDPHFFRSYPMNWDFHLEIVDQVRTKSN